MAFRKKQKDTDPESPPGHQNDIGQIYQKYHSNLKRFISSKVSFKEDAEDILQNVFYNLAKVDLVENPIDQISSWLYSVARNQIIDRSRKKKEERLPSSSKNTDDDFVSDISNLLVDYNNNPEKDYLQKIIWEELESALYELPEEQRVVWELTELQGFSFKEISESTGISVNTLLSRKRYAVLYLREQLQNLHEEVIKK